MSELRTYRLTYDGYNKTKRVDAYEDKPFVEVDTGFTPQNQYRIEPNGSLIIGRCVATGQAVFKLVRETGRMDIQSYDLPEAEMILKFRMKDFLELRVIDVEVEPKEPMK